MQNTAVAVALTPDRSDITLNQPSNPPRQQIYYAASYYCVLRLQPPYHLPLLANVWARQLPVLDPETNARKLISWAPGQTEVKHWGRQDRLQGTYRSPPEMATHLATKPPSYGAVILSCNAANFRFADIESWFGTGGHIHMQKSTHSTVGSSLPLLPLLSLLPLLPPPVLAPFACILSFSSVNIARCIGFLYLRWRWPLWV